MIESLNIDRNEQKTYLKSITTMGSPISFFNMMLNISSSKINNFTEKYQHQPFKMAKYNSFFRYHCLST